MHNSAALGNKDDEGYAITLDDDGNIYVAGYSNNGSSNDMAIWKYTSNGELYDKNLASNNINITAFGGGKGFVVHNRKNQVGVYGNNIGYAMAIGKNGDIYVVGQSWNGFNCNMTIWKYDKNGNKANKFGKDNFFTTDGVEEKGSNQVGHDIALDNNENIYVTGYSHNGNNNDMTIWRYTKQGVLNGVSKHIKTTKIDNDDKGKGIVVIPTGINGKSHIYTTGYSINGFGNKDMLIWDYGTE